MDILHPEFVQFITCANKHNLRYMLIGGYAVNYYGYNRNTQDMDVWIAPTNENKEAFIHTLLCMQYSQNEVEPIRNEDFTKPFKADIGLPEAEIDILTIVHHNISFDETEPLMEKFELENGLFINFVPYETLKNIKLLVRRDKDLNDIVQLDKIKNKTT
jgi:hypothetical protein